MSRILAIQNSCFWNKGGYKRPKETKSLSFVRSFSVSREKSGSTEEKGSGLSVVGFVLLGLLLSASSLYLFQVNSLATKGYELRDVENKIQNSEKEINELKIEEVELKSMYNMEKATKDLNLVSSSEVSYIDIAGPMAMK
jgi:cell shape-determining protein MreC